jgi:predicted RNA-binding Zn-ribbon protein involved in translation (DUF1610 family)
VLGPVRTYAEWDAEHARLDERRRARSQELLAEYRKSNRSKVYTDHERHGLAVSMGARIRGDRARDVLCPMCGKRSVWFYVSMTGHTFGGAACAHRNSCGWAGSLRALDNHGG